MTNRTAFINGVAQHVHDAAQRGLTNGHCNGSARVGDHQTTTETVRRTQRNGTHDAIAQLLLHFQCQGRAFQLEGVIHLGHLVAWELDVHHSTNTLNDFSLNLSHFLLQKFLYRRGDVDQTAAAPATISESSFVIAACRVLL